MEPQSVFHFDALSVSQFLSHVAPIFLTSQNQVKINILMTVSSQFHKRNFTLVTIFKVFCFPILLVRFV